MANTNAAAAVLAVAPDDTPTRLLDEIEKRWQDQADINTDVQFLLAEVSRLRSSEAVVADVIDRLEKHTRALHFQRTTPDNVADLVDAICEHNSKQTAEVSRLREDWQKIHEAVAGKRDVPFDVTNLCALAEAQRSDSLSVDDFEASKERAEAEVTRLQQENALLKRSLSMLVESDTRHGEDGEHD
jgi:hypothetical protein